MFYIWLKGVLLHGLRLSKCFESRGYEKAKSCDVQWYHNVLEPMQEHEVWPSWLKGALLYNLRLNKCFENGGYKNAKVCGV